MYRVGLWIRVLANRNNCERCIEHNSYTSKKTSKMAKIWARKKPYYSRPSISKTSVHHYSLSWIVFECLRNLKTCPKTFIFMGRYKTKENYFDTNNKINYGSLKEKKWRFFREKKKGWRKIKPKNPELSVVTWARSNYIFALVQCYSCLPGVYSDVFGWCPKLKNRPKTWNKINFILFCIL